MKRVYGNPPVLVVRLFLKVLAVILVIVVGVALVGLAIDRRVGMVDLIGMTITAPILAYLIHLWLAPRTQSEADKDEA